MECRGNKANGECGEDLQRKPRHSMYKKLTQHENTKNIITVVISNDFQPRIEMRLKS